MATLSCWIRPPCYSTQVFPTNSPARTHTHTHTHTHSRPTVSQQAFLLISVLRSLCLIWITLSPFKITYLSFFQQIDKPWIFWSSEKISVSTALQLLFLEVWSNASKFNILSLWILWTRYFLLQTVQDMKEKFPKVDMLFFWQLGIQRVHNSPCPRIS